MEQGTYSERLSRIQTCWSQICRAHDGPAPARQAAQRALLERYGGAIQRYLLGAVRDPDVAAELFQEFACQLLQGDLKGATPERGKFRNFLRGVLFHMVADHHRRKGKLPKQLATNLTEPAAPDPILKESEREFLDSWRDELLARTWTRLGELERKKGQPLYTVLRFRAEHPKLKSDELARELSTRLRKEVTAAGVRQMIHRARERFAELLLEDVAHSLELPSIERVEEELTDLGLLEYCRPSLEQRRSR
jgi:RNA polymerase sigma-70 factor (ECF subfamily)